MALCISTIFLFIPDLKVKPAFRCLMVTMTYKKNNLNVGRATVGTTIAKTIETCVESRRNS